MTKPSMEMLSKSNLRMMTNWIFEKIKKSNQI